MRAWNWIRSRRRITSKKHIILETQNRFNRELDHSWKWNFSLNSRVVRFLSRRKLKRERSKRFPFALIAKQDYTLFDFPRRGDLIESDRIPRGKQEWRGCSFHANQIIFRFLHSLHTPRSTWSKGTLLQARNFSAARLEKRKEHTGLKGGRRRSVEGDLGAAAGRSGTYFVAKTPWHSLSEISWLELRYVSRWNLVAWLDSVKRVLFKIVLLNQFSTINYLRLIDSSHTGQRKKKLSSRCHKLKRVIAIFAQSRLWNRWRNYSTFVLSRWHEIIYRINIETRFILIPIYREDVPFEIWRIIVNEEHDLGLSFLYTRWVNQFENIRIYLSFRDSSRFFLRDK